MPYWQLFYHMVWATKGRQPLLTPEVEPKVYGLLSAKAIELGGRVFRVNGVEEHVHMVAAVPPRIAPAMFIGQVKGYASAMFNKEDPPARLYWQEEYGIFSCDRGRLPSYIAYVERQKEHHRQGTTISLLERTDDGGVSLVREHEAPYAFEDAAWRAELEAIEREL